MGRWRRSCPRLVTLLGVFALLGTACSSGYEKGETHTPSSSGNEQVEAPVPDPIKGCVPQCNTPGLVAPGPVPTGPYETQWFFGGEMVVSLDEEWFVNA